MCYRCGRDERQESGDPGSTREGFVAIKGRAKRFAPTAASSTAARIAQIGDCRRGVRQGSATERFILPPQRRVCFYQSFQQISGAPEEIRTPDPQIRSLVLYPAELRARRSA